MTVAEKVCINAAKQNIFCNMTIVCKNQSFCTGSMMEIFGANFPSFFPCSSYRICRIVLCMHVNVHSKQKKATFMLYLADT